MKPIEFDGMVFGPEKVRSMREQLIVMRDEALKHSRLDWGMTLSYIVVVLKHTADEMEIT